MKELSVFVTVRVKSEDCQEDFPQELKRERNERKKAKEQEKDDRGAEASRTRKREDKKSAKLERETEYEPTKKQEEKTPNKKTPNSATHTHIHTHTHSNKADTNMWSWRWIQLRAASPTSSDPASLPRATSQSPNRDLMFNRQRSCKTKANNENPPRSLWTDQFPSSPSSLLSSSPLFSSVFAAGSTDKESCETKAK